MNRETLLLVEDNHDLRNGLQDILSYEGFTVLSAQNGLEALEKMKNTFPDLILSDITMPVMDGLDLFRMVRSRPEWIAIPFIFLTARGEREDIMTGRGLGAEDYLVKPLSPEELVSAVKGRLARSRQLRVAQLRQAYQGSLTMLANAIEVRSEYTRGHVERVTAYALALGQRLELQPSRMEILRYGAILHDIGKIHIPDKVLIKQNTLTHDEWLEIRQHPVTGAEMVKNIPYLIKAVPVIRHHHERWDGKGYPDGLKGEAIPLEARIVSVADSFDAMTTDRSYHPALSLLRAHDEIVKCSGVQYDPGVIAAFDLAWDRGTIQRIAQEHFPIR